MDTSVGEAFLGAEIEWADVGSTRVAFRQFGSGPPLLLVHGFPLSGYTWRKIIPELSKHCTCIVPDTAGLGDTEWSADTDFSFPGQGAMLKGLVDGLGIDRFSVLGQDTGGTFSRFLALSAVDRVDHLLIINSEIPGHRPPYIPMYQFFMRFPGTPVAFRALLRSQMFLRSGMGFGGCFNDISLIENDFREQVIDPVLHSDAKLEGLRRFLIGARWDPVDALKQDHSRLTMPTRLIWAVDDPTFPIELARAMVVQFPNAELVEIDGGRLLVHEEKPAEVTQAILEFLN